MSGEPGWYRKLFDPMSLLITAALACDLTRVVTLQMGGPNIVDLGLPPGDIHEGYAHHSEETQEAKNGMIKYHAYHAQMISDLAQSLARIPEGSGTLLDNTLIVWTGELASGQHAFAVLPMFLVGGRGMGVKTGRLVHYAQNVPTADSNDGDPKYQAFRGPGHNKLLTSVQQILGVPNANSTGAASVRAHAGGTIDLTGPLPRLI
jgi:hypothetical protein